MLIGVPLLMIGEVGLALLCAGRDHVLRPSELLGLSLMLGSAIVGASTFVLGTVIQGTALILTVSVLCLILAYLGWRRTIKGRTWDWKAGPLRLWERPGSCSSPETSADRARIVLIALLCAAIALQFMLVTFISLVLPLFWDGLVVWELKARLAFLNGGVIPPASYSAGWLVWTHPYYPFLLPQVEAWLYSWMGQADQGAIKLLFPSYYAATALLLYAAVARVTGDRVRGLLVASLLFFMPSVVIGEGSATSGFADFTVAAFYTAACIYALIYTLYSGLAPLGLSILLATALPFIKQEGAVLMGAVAIVLAAQVFQRAHWRLAILLCLPAIVVGAVWILIRATAHAVDSTVYLPVSPETGIANVSRIGEIVPFYATELRDVSHWSLLWLLVPAALVLPLAAVPVRLRIACGVLVFLPMLMLGLSFIFSSYGSATAHMSGSVTRLLVQLAPLAVLAVGLLAWTPRTPPVTATRAPGADRPARSPASAMD